MVTKIIRVNEEIGSYGKDELLSLPDFCSKIKKSLEEYFGEEGKVILQQVRKNNGVILNGITVSRKESNVAPTIYLEDPYFSYQSGMPFYEIIQKIIQLYDENRLRQGMDIDFFSDYEKVKTRLGFKLVNYEMNQELLKEIPHERFLDLAVVCYCLVVNDLIGNGSILIHREHLAIWKVSKEQLLKDAKENMQRLFPVEIRNMVDLVSEIFEKNEITGLPGIISEMKAYGLQMFVLCNTNKMNGAGTILYDHVLEQLGEQFQSDFYILPSSVHEVILIPKNDEVEEDYLSEMIKDVNETQLETEEILADHAYLYSRKDQKITSLA